ncbi:MAG TPA: hypothetical protein VLW17_15290 [Thermoanaerobaculaceae bacterium]|nr:hypothetical protein [Thermoanaerobaculaceae bacterium]
MGVATALWIVVPLAAVHLLVRRNRPLLAFQLLVDAMLLLLPGRILLRGAHVGPGVAGAQAWGAPVTISGSPEQSDFPLQLTAWWEEVRRLARAGDPPWISDRIGGGVPLFAGGQSEIPFPLQAPVWALGASRGTDVMAVWKLELAALGGFLLLRRLRVVSQAAALGAGMFAFGTFMTSWLPSPLTWVVAATPWAWFLLLGALRGRRKDTAVLALLLGAIAGWSVNAESAAFLWMSVFGGGVVLVWGRLRRLVRLAVPFLLALMVAGVGAIPTLAQIAGSARLEAAAQSTYPASWIDWPLRVRVLELLLAPWRQGHPADLTWNLPFPAATVALFVGSSAWVFLLAAAPRRRLRRVALAGIVQAAGALVLLVQFPFFAALLARVPVLRLMVWARAAYLVDFGLCVVAALAADRFIREPRPLRLLAVAAAVTVLAALLVATGPVAAGVRRGVPLLAFAPIVALVASARAGRRGWWVPVLCMAEVGLASGSLLPASRPAGEVPQLVASLVEDATREGGRVLGLGAALPANLAAGLGLSDLRSHDPMRPEALTRLHEALGAAGRDLPGEITSPWAGLSGAWGVRWLVAPPAGVAGASIAGWEDVARFANGRIFRNSRALPVVRLATHAVAPPGDPGAGAWEGLNFATTAVVAEPVSLGGTGTLALIEARPWRYTARVEADGQVLALLHSPSAPGWAAWLDGSRARIVEANLGAMGVVVPAGRHEVRWQYAPVGLGAGIALTLLGLAGCLALAVVSRRRS